VSDRMAKRSSNEKTCSVPKVQKERKIKKKRESIEKGRFVYSILTIPCGRANGVNLLGNDFTLADFKGEKSKNKTKKGKKKTKTPQTHQPPQTTNIKKFNQIGGLVCPHASSARTVAGLGSVCRWLGAAEGMGSNTWSPK